MTPTEHIWWTHSREHTSQKLESGLNLLSVVKAEIDEKEMFTAQGKPFVSVFCISNTKKKISISKASTNPCLCSQYNYITSYDPEQLVLITLD